MASFTDNPQAFQFNPYIQELNTDAYTRVGMLKQQQFDTGVQKVQSWIDTLTNLPIAKQETKDYVQQQLGQLRSHLSTSITGDFADGRLLNQVGGFTSRLANDPIVQNGVQSTLKAQKAIAQMEEDKKNGKWSPANEYDFMEGYNRWIGDGRADTSFDGSYSTKVDYMDLFLKRYKEVHPSSTLTQQDVRVKDGSGVIEVLNERTHEGIDAGEVQKIWSSVMADPTVSNQLRIDAKYQYRGMDGEGFAKHLQSGYQSTIDEINKKIADIEARKAIDKTLDPKQAAAAVKALRQTGDQYLQQYNQIGQLIADGNVEGAKTALYTTNLSADLATTYSWSKDTDKIVDSPLWKAHMDQVGYELNLAKFAEEKQYHHDQLALEAQKILMQATKGKSGTKALGPGDLPDGTGTISSVMPVDEHAGEKTSMSFYDSLKASKVQMGQEMARMIFSISNVTTGAVNPFKQLADGTLVYNFDKSGKNPNAFKSEEEARQAGARIYQDARSGIVKGTAAPHILNYFQSVDPLIRKVRRMQTAADEKEAMFKPQMDQINKVLKQNNIADAATVKLDDNHSRKVSLVDMVDYYTATTQSGAAAEAAQKRIEGRLGANGLQFLKDNINYSHGGLGVPQLRNYYKQVEKVFSKNSGLINPMLQREEEFKKLQLAFKPIQTTILANKAEEKENYRQQFLNLVSARNINGDATDFIDILTKEQGNNTYKDNTYSVIYDPNTGKHFLEVKRGQDSKSFEVTEDQVRGMGFQTTNDFWQKFGDDLSLTQNTRTDIDGKGNHPYIMPSAPNSKYQVKYHLVGNGNGLYDLVLYVNNNPGKGEKAETLLPGIPLGNWFSQSEIMKIVNQGLPDAVISSLIH